MIFDGNQLAIKIEESLGKRVARMEKKPILDIVVVGEEEASRKYVQKKKEMGERIGVVVNVHVLTTSFEGIKNRVGELAMGPGNGLMVQLPMPGLSKQETNDILALIPLEKDVDGLNPENLVLIESGDQTFVPATVKAVERILDEAFRETEMDIDEKLKIAVVGSKGMVGAPLVARIKRYGIEVGEFDLGDSLDGLIGFDVVISCTGSASLISPKMVKHDVIAIDVGFPKGDFESEVEKKAIFFTPVPGGVGPVTVALLLENVVESVDRDL